MSEDRRPPPEDAADRVEDTRATDWDRLLEAAGPRPDVSADVASMRAAAREAWQAGLRRERSRRVAVRALALAAGLVLVLSVGWLAVTLRRSAGTTDQAPTVVIASTLRVIGEPVAIEPNGGRRVLGVGAALAPGERVETAAGEHVALALATERSLRLDSDTSLTLLDAARVSLARGEVYVDSGAGAPGSLEVATAVGVAREVGTRFSVALEDGTVAVRVRDGRVVLESGADRMSVPAGEELVRSEDGEAARRELPPSDPSWDWVVRSAPPFEIEGRTVADYLRWLSRETGWTVEYATPAAAAAASEAVLHGSLTGDDPRDTLDAVLPSADLAYRLADGVLLVGE
jgi:ferric-dicitrate binding protein FerR (iron transport regulator)